MSNVARGDYVSSQEFLRDVKLMASNAALFNGADSQIAKDGAKLHETAKQLVETDKAAFETFEADVRAK